MAHALLKALSRASAYAAKKGTLWADVTDRIAGALLPADLDDVEVWLDDHELEVPEGWVQEFAELIEKRRDELAAEDIGQILLDRFDFNET